ncbi:MAG: EamA family transporter [Clostridia bacterium]|nr:EamA family transporter [Clostridia bacterium]
MAYLYLIGAVCSSAMLSIMSSLFGRQNAKHKNVSYFYSAIVACIAFASWGIISVSDAEFSPRVILYSLIYGLFYTAAMIGMFKAYQVGSVSLTAFVKQLSLIGVAIWGFLFWNTPLTVNVAIGLVFVGLALCFCFKPNKDGTEKIVSAKWVLFAFMLLVGNAGCSIIQKYQQSAFDGNCGNAFMFFAAGIAFACSVLFYFCNERCRINEISKRTLLYPITGGISSALLNFFIMRLIASPLSESIVFPGIAAGGLILTTVFSTVCYRERLHRYQWLGLGIGVIALIFLNI